MSDYTTDLELTDDLKAWLRAAGASEDFMTFLATDAPGRHSVREQIAKELYWSVIGLETDPEAYVPTGGHFFAAMWEGDLFEAWIRADLQNRPLMLDCFGATRIIENGIYQGEHAEYAHRLVTEAAL